MNAPAAVKPRRLALITDPGAVGRAVTELLCARGWQVAVLYVTRLEQQAKALVQEFGAERVFAQPVDYEEPATLEAAHAAVTAHFGRAPDDAVLLFNDWLAGGPLHLGPADDAGAFTRLTTANFETVYRTLRVVLPAMVGAGDGSVVVLGSRLAERPWSAAGAGAYAAAKAACVALVSSTASEVLAHGVRVNAVLASVIDEPFGRLGAPQLDHSLWVAPRSIAAVAAFLLSEEARDISGAAIPVYGRA